MQDQASVLESELRSKKHSLKLKRKTYDLLPNAEENVAKLQVPYTLLLNDVYNVHASKLRYHVYFSGLCTQFQNSSVFFCTVLAFVNAPVKYTNYRR